MGHEAFHFDGREKVIARNPEVTDAHSSQGFAHLLRVAVGIDDHRHGLLVGVAQTAGDHLPDVVKLLFETFAVGDAQLIAPSVVGIGRQGQQLRRNVQNLLGVFVEDAQEVAGRPMIDAQMMNMAPATVFQLLDNFHFGPHERENGLLVISQIDHCGLLIGEQIDDAHLQRVEILHLVDLNPFVARVGVQTVVAQYVEGDDQQVLEVEQMMVALVFLVFEGELHFSQCQSELPAVGLPEGLTVEKVFIEVGVAIDVVERRRRELHALRLADRAQRQDVLPRQHLLMHAYLTGMPADDLMNEVGELHHLRVVLLPMEIVADPVLVLLQESGNDGDRLFIVDDGAVVSYETVGKQKTGTKPVDVAHKHGVYVLIIDDGMNAFKHASRRPVGESQAQHLAEGNPLAMRAFDSLAEDLRFSTARRRQYQMVTPFSLDDLPLRFIGNKFYLLHHLKFLCCSAKLMISTGRETTQGRKHA